MQPGHIHYDKQSKDSNYPYSIKPKYKLVVSPITQGIEAVLLFIGTTKMTYPEKIRIVVCDEDYEWRKTGYCLGRSYYCPTHYEVVHLSDVIEKQQKDDNHFEHVGTLTVSKFKEVRDLQENSELRRKFGGRAVEYEFIRSELIGETIPGILKRLGLDTSDE